MTERSRHKISNYTTMSYYKLYYCIVYTLKRRETVALHFLIPKYKVHHQPKSYYSP